MTDANLTSWIEVPEGHDFPLANLPFGIFSTADRDARPGMRLGDQVIDLSALFHAGLLDDLGLTEDVLSEASALNPLMKLGKPTTVALRERVQDLFASDSAELRDRPELHASCLVPASSVTMHMPVEVGDYTDFYSSEDHARNVGKMFRDPENALLPNWKHMPVGYHGRASSIVVSGTPIRRPMGQTRPDPEAPPVFGPSRLLDFELEMAFVTFDGKPLGERITTAEAEDYIFGLVLFNDWSARDIQKWEYVPLGPFLGKNFGSSISPGSSPSKPSITFASRPATRPRGSRLPEVRRQQPLRRPARSRNHPRRRCLRPNRLPLQLPSHVLEHAPATGPPHGQRLQPSRRRHDGERHHQRPRKGFLWFHAGNFVARNRACCHA